MRWLGSAAADRLSRLSVYFAEEFARFTDRVGDRLPPERRDVYERLIDSGPRLNKRYHSHRNMTTVKAIRMSGTSFTSGAGSNDVRIFDWDCWRAGVGTDDLAYMMALHWYANHRRRNEPLLLDHYHAELLAHGVTGYDRHALDDDYRLSVLWQIATPVWQAANNIPAEFWWNNLERTFLAIDDLGCRDLLVATSEGIARNSLPPHSCGRSNSASRGTITRILISMSRRKGLRRPPGYGFTIYSAIGSQRKPSPQRLM